MSDRPNPTFTREQALSFLQQRGITEKIVWLGYRSAGSHYGQYDDTIALLTPDQYIEYKANTLPSIWQPGVATLVPGVYRYKKGLHGIHHLGTGPADKAILVWLNGNVGKDYPAGSDKILPYWAFRQAGPVTLQRDGQTGTETITDPNSPKWPWIDLHRGGWNGTSSLGCQTFFPDHWPQARAAGYQAMDRYDQDHILYSLHQL